MAEAKVVGRLCFHWSPSELLGTRNIIVERLDNEGFVEPSYYRGLLASINAEIAYRTYALMMLGRYDDLPTDSSAFDA